MASQKFISISFFLLVVISSVSAHYPTYHPVPAAKPHHVSPFCALARRKGLCNKIVNGATNRNEAIRNAIGISLSLAKSLKLKSHLIAPAIAAFSPISKKSLQGTCKASFETAVDMLHEAKIALAAGDIGTLKIKLSAALDTECADELSNFGANFPLANSAKKLHLSVSLCLALTAKME